MSEEDEKTGGLDAAIRGHLGAFDLDVAFRAPAGRVTALFGRSGSGKTSALRAIAGLSRLDATVSVGGETWQDGSVFRPTHRRAVGYVFQDAGLFAHLSVERNLLFGARRAPGGVDRAGLEEIVELLQIGHLRDRSPVRLSGGERQRVALGRALLCRPALLLMDEPLSALDRFAKDAILPFIEALHGRLAVPVLYVSHDLSEVERLADRMVVVDEGRVVAAGALNEALTRSGFRSEPGSAAVLPATIRVPPGDDGLAELDVGGQRLFAETDAADARGTRRRVRIAAADVSLVRGDPATSTILNHLDVRIERIDPASRAHVTVLLSLAGAPELTLLARVTRRSAERLSLAEGEDVRAQIKAVSLATAGALD